MRLEFEFIQVAMGLRERLSTIPSVHEWQVLFEFCKRQSLLGFGFAAVEKLHEVGVECPADIRLKWYGYALKIERMNEKLNMQCGEITKRYEHDGLRCCILKGQGNLLNYPKGLSIRRMPGDIDLWCITPPSGLSMPNASLRDYTNYHGINAVIEYVRMQYRLQGIDANPKACYHHIDAPSMDGTKVEVHYRPAFLRSPLRNCRMQRWFEHHADECMKNKTHLGFSMMTSSVNVVYQMCHLYTHLFEGGIGLRQLMDYYFALRVWHNDVMECKDLQSQGMWSEGLGTPVMSAQEVMAVIRSFGMGKFAGAVMWVLNEVFGGGNENENENGQRRTRRETDGGPQADFVGEQVSINDERLMINDFVHTENTEGNGGSQADGVGECESSEFKQNLNGCPQADDGGERKLSGINRELKENIFAPWMICEPNEKEGKRLLEEIMKGGNFGQYDTRDAALKRGGMMKHGVWKLKRVMRLVSSYPEEALWEPVFRVWHLGWRKMNG